MKTNQDTKQKKLDLRIDEELLNKFKDKCKQEDISASEVVRDLIKIYIESK